MIYVTTLLVELLMYGIVYLVLLSLQSLKTVSKIDVTTFGRTRILSMIIKQIFMEPETEVKWYFGTIEEIVIVYIRNRLRGTFACACNTLRLSSLDTNVS